jgi:hypothetical protein
VGVEQHHSDGLAQDGAAPDHDGVPPFNGDGVIAQQAHDPGGGGRAKGRLAHGHATKTQRGDAVHVLFDGDAVEGLPFVDVRWDGVLQEDAVHGRVGVERIDLRQELGGGGVFGQNNLE